METLIGIGIWVIIFVVWYVRNYPEKFRGLGQLRRSKVALPRRKKVVPMNRPPRPRARPDFKTLVEKVESLSARDRMSASDAAAMVAAVRDLMEIEPASGQIWEAFALDSLETAQIICDDCRIPVEKIVKKTGVKIECKRCRKWLALKNSKVTIIDPNRANLEDWEK